MTVIVVNGHPRSSNPRSYHDVCLPHWYERCPCHHELVKFDGKGHLLGRCQGCATDAAQGIRHIEETIA